MRDPSLLSAASAAFLCLTATALFQWGVIDPAAKGIGIAFSNGAKLFL